MIETMRNNLEISEEKNIKNTLLYIRKIKVNEESYETKILQEENIDNVIKFQIGYEGEETMLFYDVSNTISLDEYIKTYKLKKSDICKIIDSIDTLLSTIENYLISENSVSLDLRLIRVERKFRNSFGLKFLIIPNHKSDFSYELSKFLIKILRYIDIEDKNALKLAYGLFVRSSKDNYTINDLMELVNIVRDKNDSVIKDIDIEAQRAYDEETIEEMQDEFLGNDVLENIPELSEYIDAEKNMEAIIDNDTKDVLNEELFDKFDDPMPDKQVQNKVIKFKKKLFDLRPKKALKAHISFNLCKNIMIPIFCLVMPIIYYIRYGHLEFVTKIPFICLCEIVILTLYVITIIQRQ